VIGAAVVAVIGVAVAWQGGWLRSGPADSAGRTTAVAPAPSPPSAPAAEKTASPTAAIDANAARAQAEADAQRLRADAEALKRQAEAELARARSEADAGKAARAKADADAAAARLRAQAEADAARIRAEAEASAARTRSDAERAARATVAQAPKPAPAQPEPAAKAQVTPVAAPDKSPPASPTSVARFDGTWNVNVECSKHPDGAAGYVIGLVAEVKDGVLRGEKAVEGAAGEIRIQGIIQPDGTAKLEVKGTTGDDPKFLLKGSRTRTPYGYDVAAQFDASRGTGRRLQHRACALTFVRQ
jgi:multidrug efflux pump subunit AcrA (membrane-fusion protein)